MSFIGKFKELKDIFKTAGLYGVRNNIQYEIYKLDEDIEAQKNSIKKTKENIRNLKSTRK